MSRATELNAYRNRPSGSKPDIRQGVNHIAHVATIHCATPELESTIRQVDPSSPTTTDSASSRSLPLRKDEPTNHQHENDIEPVEKDSESPTKHNLARAASWETVQTTATSLYRAPSSPSNPHFINSIPSIPTLARDYTLSNRPERINTHLRPPIPGSYPLSSPARPGTDKKKSKPPIPALRLKPVLHEGKDERTQAVRANSIKRLQTATSARLRKTVRKLDIYHDPANSPPTTAISTSASQAEVVGLGITRPSINTPRTHSVSPRSETTVPRSPAEKENLADYAGAYSGQDGDLQTRVDRDEGRGRFTPEIWEDEGMVVGAGGGFEGVEVYEGT